MSISPDNLQLPLFTNVDTITDTQKLDANEKELAEFADKMTTHVTKLINAQMNLSVQTEEKDTWQEEMTVKSK